MPGVLNTSDLGDEAVLESILKQLIGVARLGPTQRMSLQKALASRDQTLMLGAGQKVVNALLQRGDLVRVEIQRSGRTDRRLYALRNHAQLLDLTPLTSEPREPAASSPPRDPPPAARPTPSSDSPTSGDAANGLGLRARDQLLEAMEQAQVLQTVMPVKQDPAAWLDPILTMLRGTMPGVDLFIELLSPPAHPLKSQQLFTCEKQDRPFWALNRVPGEAVWIPALSELPRPLLALIGDNALVEHFATGIAVPLYRAEVPDDIGEPDPEHSEVAMLYALSTKVYPREELTKLAARLSRFVTHSWQQRLLMNRLVHTDPLTGLRNRGFFDSQLSLELERSRRQNSSLMLLLGDIDHFKDVNDTYGHPMGDLVLKTVARELLQGLRRIDVVCRIGGEEFALILPDTDMEAARDVVTRIQVRIANLRLTDAKHPEPLRVTISFGGVSFPEGGTEAEALYSLADEMLYLSKERGRNRCHFWRLDDDPLLTLPQYKTD